MKKVLIILLCLLCIPVVAQEKAFKAGLKKGRNANGYYHADLSKMAFTEEELVNYANKNGYLIRNLVEGQVMQFGSYYTAVVSLDFIPVGEASKEDRALARSDSSPIVKDAHDKMMELGGEMLKVLKEQPGKDIVTYKENVWHQPNAKDKVIAAGAAVDYYFVKYITGGLGNDYIHYSFVHRDQLEKALKDKVFGGKNQSFSSEGKGYFYNNIDYNRGKSFISLDHIRWSGKISGNGSLEGDGIGYCAIPEGESVGVYCLEGSFRDGKPVGTLRCVKTNGYSLIESNPQAPAVLTITPLEGGLLLCKVNLPDWQFYSVVNDNYEPRIENSSILAKGLLEEKNYSTNKDSDFVDAKNGLFTFRWHQSELDTDLDFTVDSDGTLVGFPEKTRDALNLACDEILSHYDKYLSKVLNPTDVIRPYSALKQRFNYDIDQFPHGKCRALMEWEGLRKAFDDFKAHNPAKADKVRFADDTYCLLKETYHLEEEDKQNRVERARDFALNSPLTKPNLLFFERYVTLEDIGLTERTYIVFEYGAEEVLKRMELNPAKPSNFSATEKAIRDGYKKTKDWWDVEYAKANYILSDRISRNVQKKKDHAREMCEKCLVLGKESTFPKGYVEAYKGLFIDRPAQSEEDGVLVLQNGEKCDWKFIYYDNETIIELSGSYGGKFKSVDEMVENILKECNSRWGTRAR